MIRLYELSNLPGKPAPYKKMRDRRALIGKRIGYDLRGSSYAHYGTVTCVGRYEIFVDGSEVLVGSIEQLNIIDVDKCKAACEVDRG